MRSLCERDREIERGREKERDGTMAGGTQAGGTMSKAVLAEPTAMLYKKATAKHST